MKQGKYRYLATPIPLYGCLFHIIVGHDLTEASRVADLSTEGFNGNDLKFYQAFTFRADRADEVGYFAMLQPDASADTVAHESVHIVNKIFNDRGIRLDSHNDEPQAYLTGWVAGKINEALTSDRIKAKKTIKLC